MPSDAIWPDPGVISVAPARRDFPVDALPRVAREAIIEYQRYGKQPVPLIVSAALGTMALATQAHSDVARDAVLRGPCSLNLLVLGDSGERKSAADTAFTRPIHQWVEEQTRAQLVERRKDEAQVRLNEERRKSVQKRLAELEAKTVESTAAERQRLEMRLGELEEDAATLFVRPLPALTYEDATAEGLAFAVATGWPSAALMSDEAGLVIGGRGMSDEGALALLSLLNRLYDGRPFRPTRKVAVVVEIRGRRFSASLMLQPELLAKIIEKGGRGVGFLARYLICEPLSTMGTRYYTPPATATPALSRFHRRVLELLNKAMPVNDRYELEPPVMTLDNAALDIWRTYHDQVERELGKFGCYAGVKDVGAKSAENAARIACNFQVWDQGPSEHLRADYIEMGIQVARWYLDEANRLFFEAEKPAEISDAELLSDWLTTVAPTLRDQGIGIMVDGRMSIGDILRLGPNRLRDKDRRDRALELLGPGGMDGFHLRLEHQGRRKELVMNPKLLVRRA